MGHRAITHRSVANTKTRSGHKANAFWSRWCGTVGPSDFV